MKKLLAILLALLMVLSIVGCAKEEAPADDAADAPADDAADTSADDAADAPADDAAAYRVGFCLPDRDQYWTTFETAAVATCEELGVEPQVVVAKEDISTQLSQIETFKNDGFNAIILGITNGESYAEAIKAAGDMKIVFFNRSISDNSVLDGVNYIYVGMSEYDAGYAQGTWLAENFAGETELKGVMFMGPLGLDNVTNRTQGAKDALADAGITVEWVFEDTAEWDRAKAMDKFTQFNGTGTEYDFVVANNDEMALGVIEACTASGTEIDFPIVGIDATEVGCMALQEGTLKMTVNQNATGQGKVAVEAVVALLNGEAVEGIDADTNILATDAQAVTAENAAEVLAVFQG